MKFWSIKVQLFRNLINSPRLIENLSFENTLVCKNKVALNMEHTDVFFYFTRIFGFSPFTDLAEKKEKKNFIMDFRNTAPSFFALFIYACCLLSMFWQTGKSGSDISNAANWIQVRNRI